MLAILLKMVMIIDIHFVCKESESQSMLRAQVIWSHTVLHLTPNPQWPATQLGPPVLFLCLCVLLVHSR